MYPKRRGRTPESSIRITLKGCEDQLQGTGLLQCVVGIVPLIHSVFHGLSHVVPNCSTSWIQQGVVPLIHSVFNGLSHVVPNCSAAWIQQGIVTSTTESAPRGSQLFHGNNRNSSLNQCLPHIVSNYLFHSLNTTGCLPHVVSNSSTYWTQHGVFDHPVSAHVVPNCSLS